jgi:cell division protein FtsZ
MEFPMKSSTPGPAAKDESAPGLTMKVIGVGGAGCNLAEHMAAKYFPGVSFYALNTDLKSLAGCTTALTHPLGAKRIRGLGAGGDPVMGRAAAEEDAEQMRVLCAGMDVVVIATGLGGGTGTGASPVLARIAREAGALVLAVATLPFECEGSRRSAQARAGLEELKAAADAVICLPNERVLRLIDENTSLVETFKISNEFVTQGVRAIWRLLTRTGILNVDFADLCSVVRSRHAESCFATVEARGENRAREVIDRLMESPFLESGAVLGESESVLVSLAGGTELTMAEVSKVMAQINRACDRAQIVMGATVDEEFAGRLSATVIATRRQPARDVEIVSASAELPVEPNLSETGDAKLTGSEAIPFEEQFLSPEQPTGGRSRFVPPPPSLTAEETERALARQNSGRAPRKPRSKMRQGVLPLEIVSKGRFEKSEPTVYEGEDLDVPTYIRRGVPLN